MLEYELKPRKRRILTDFVVDKIAAVDNPCQEHARVAIIKRRDDDESLEIHRMAEDFPRLVFEVQKRDSCSRYDALMTAAIENPEAVQAYRHSSPVRMNEIAKRDDAIAKGHDRQRKINKHKREIMARDRVDATTALMTLHDEAPDVFES